MCLPWGQVRCPENQSALQTEHKGLSQGSATCGSGAPLQLLHVAVTFYIETRIKIKLFFFFLNLYYSWIQPVAMCFIYYQMRLLCILYMFTNTLWEWPQLRLDATARNDPQARSEVGHWGGTFIHPSQQSSISTSVSQQSWSSKWRLFIGCHNYSPWKNPSTGDPLPTTCLTHHFFIPVFTPRPWIGDLCTPSFASKRKYKNYFIFTFTKKNTHIYHPHTNLHLAAPRTIKSTCLLKQLTHFIYTFNVSLKRTSCRTHWIQVHSSALT